MSNVISGGEQRKPVIVIFFQRGNDTAMKNFASRLRNEERAEVNLVWANLFDIDAMPKAEAVIIQKDVRNAENIARAYKRVLPDIEVHYCTGEGQWDHEEVPAADEPFSIGSAPSNQQPTEQVESNVQENAAQQESESSTTEDAGEEKDRSEPSPSPSAIREAAADADAEADSQGDEGFSVPSGYESTEGSDATSD